MSHFDKYLISLHDLIASAQATDQTGCAIPLANAMTQIDDVCRATDQQGGQSFFIGNGGSAGIASHMANDFTKNGGLRALFVSDPAVLTCLSNDFGYENVYAKTIEFYARPGDTLIAFSSSGQSANMINAAKAAQAKDMSIVTFTGFAPTNPLRSLGQINIYVASSLYGFVEVAHQTLIHAVLDLAMGWQPSDPSGQP